MRKLHVDEETIRKKIEEYGNSETEQRYEQVDLNLQMRQTWLSLWYYFFVGLLAPTLPILCISCTAFSEPLSGSTLFALYFAEFFSLLWLGRRLEMLCLRLFLPRIWANYFREFVELDRKNNRMSADLLLLRGVDWRFDLALAKLGHGHRMRTKGSFRWAKSATADGSNPWTLLKTLTLRLETAVIALIASIALAQYGQAIAAIALTTLTLLIGLGHPACWTWRFICGWRRGQIVDRFVYELQNLELAEVERNDCSRLYIAVKSNNAQATKMFLTWVLDSLLSQTEDDVSWSAVTRHVLPVLYKHFGKPLPAVLKSAMDHYDPPNLRSSSSQSEPR